MLTDRTKKYEGAIAEADHHDTDQVSTPRVGMRKAVCSLAWERDYLDGGRQEFQWLLL